MIDAYHKYNFEYNEKNFMSNFKKVIVSKLQQKFFDMIAEK